MKMERGKMEYIGVLLAVCAVCIIGVVFIWARSEEPAADRFTAQVLSLKSEIDILKSSAPADVKSTAELLTKMETMAINLSKLRLELESVRSHQSFPAEQKVTIAQLKPFEVHLVPDRPVGKLKPKRSAK